MTVTQTLVGMDSIKWFYRGEKKMHTVKLKMEDSIYSNIMFMLRNLQLKGLEIEEIIKLLTSIVKSSQGSKFGK